MEDAHLHGRRLFDYWKDTHDLASAHHALIYPDLAASMIGRDVLKSYFPAPRIGAPPKPQQAQLNPPAPAPFPP